MAVDRRETTHTRLSESGKHWLAEMANTTRTTESDVVRACMVVARKHLPELEAHLATLARF